MKKWCFALLFLFLGGNVCHAQSGLYSLNKEFESDDPFDELTHLDLGMNLMSNNVYLGRKDGNKLPYLTPYISYHLRSGFYFSASESYAFTKKSGHFDLTAFEAGYDQSFGSNFLAGASINKYIYYKNSPAVRAAITESGSIYSQYRNDLIEPQLTFTYNNGINPDILIAIGVDHHFQSTNKKWNTYPSFTFYTGSLNYYNNYYINRTLRQDNIVISNAIDNAGGIKPVNVELSAKTTLLAKNWLFTLTPTFAIPLSASKVTLPGGVINEKLKNTFFIELDACFRRPRERFIN